MISEAPIQHTTLSCSYAFVQQELTVGSTNINDLLQRNLRLQLITSAPPTSTSSGTKGDVVNDDNYLYVCVETNVWIRSSIGTAW